jgi:MoxR-like ATPase
LPEAQLDRFMFNVVVGYPSRAEELEIVQRTTSRQSVELEPILDAETILKMQDLVRQVVVADHVFQYAVDLVRATRPRENEAPKWVSDLIAWGAGPRASQYLILGGKARAILFGRLHVTTDDIREIAHPVLRHRLVTTFNADAEGVTTDQVITRLLDALPPPQKAAVQTMRRV